MVQVKRKVVVMLQIIMVLREVLLLGHLDKEPLLDMPVVAVACMAVV